MYDYKLVEGFDRRYGRYHIKFHNLEGLGVFDEIHIVFERYDRTGYFFYTDQGDLIDHKSSGLRRGNRGLTAHAQQIVNRQLATSATVSNEWVAEQREQRAAIDERNREQREIWVREAEERRAREVDEELRRKVEELTGEREDAARLHAAGLLAPILQQENFSLFIRFTIKDPITDWPGELRNLAHLILRAVTQIDVDTIVSNAGPLTSLEKAVLTHLMWMHEGETTIHLPGNIFTMGENPVLEYDAEDVVTDRRSPPH